MSRRVKYSLQCLWVLLLYRAMTSGSDNSYEDSDSGNTDYQLNTANGSYSPSHYSNLMLVSKAQVQVSINANRLSEAHIHGYAFAIYERRTIA